LRGGLGFVSFISMKKAYLLIAIGAAAAAAAGFYVTGGEKSEPSPAAENQNDRVVIEEIKSDSAIPKYSGQTLEYLADPAVIAKYPAQFVEGKKEQFEKALKAVAADPQNSEHWLDIGLLKNTFNNYAGARDAWEHAKLLEPGQSVIWYNLANLYGNYLGNFDAAERHFQKAIALEPDSAYLYIGLASFYRDFYTKKSDQVDDVLLAGLKQIPDDANFFLGLGFYYKSAGDPEKAIEYFEKFLKAPDTSEAQKAAIEREIAALKYN